MMKLIRPLSIFNFIFFFSSICSILAQAPQTPKIVFSLIDNKQNSEIYLMNPDGTDQVRLTYNKAFDVSAVWSPTGEQILFASDRDGVRDLYLMDADGKNVKRVFGKSEDRRHPTWSPDGKQIAYTRRKQGKGFIYIAPIDGKKEEQVAIGAVPAWSPDGTEIAFITGAIERKQISLLNVSTYKQKVFFPKPAKPSWLTSPAWSPSGDKLAFAWLHKVPLGEFADTQTIYIINRDGTGLQQVIDDGTGRESSPAWSPQGDELLYTQYIKGQQMQIFKIGLDRGTPVQLTDPTFWHFTGDWFDPAYALPVSPQPQLLTTTWGDVKKRN
ncbi:hypothetical protein C6500_18320 [Candidatus Poribacteria bacterium]|nr:MAG: hypothetical protein C6500_18320 [Candidatus Poribacteria bacterium]